MIEKFAAIDFETANGKRSSVCSVGIVILEQGNVCDRFYRLIRPRPNFYTHWTTAVHGMSYYDTVNEADFPEVWSEIAARVEGIPFVAHNSPFDSGCLLAVHELYSMHYPEYPFYCTCRLARKAFPSLENHQLHTVSSFCGYDLTHHHNALADAEACAHIAVTLLQNRGVETLAQLQADLIRKK